MKIEKLTGDFKSFSSLMEDKIIIIITPKKKKNKCLKKV